ncbi:hypothetical protein Q5705_17815 [Kosakonia sp. H02]|nr:hypothetical protein Q5705_17815 [Kosakonia sp. H02]
MNSRTSADLGWQVLDEFERARLEKPFVPVKMMADRKQVDRRSE